MSETTLKPGVYIKFYFVGESNQAANRNATSTRAFG